jgi:hypothetical protein
MDLLDSDAEAIKRKLEAENSETGRKAGSAGLGPLRRLNISSKYLKQADKYRAPKVADGPAISAEKNPTKEAHEVNLDSIKSSIHISQPPVTALFGKSNSKVRTDNEVSKTESGSVEQFRGTNSNDTTGCQIYNGLSDIQPDVRSENFLIQPVVNHTTGADQKFDQFETQVQPVVLNFESIVQPDVNHTTGMLSKNEQLDKNQTLNKKADTTGSQIYNPLYEIINRTDEEISSSTTNRFEMPLKITSVDPKAVNRVNHSLDSISRPEAALDTNKYELAITEDLYPSNLKYNPMLDIQRGVDSKTNGITTTVQPVVDNTTGSNNINNEIEYNSMLDIQRGENKPLVKNLTNHDLRSVQPDVKYTTGPSGHSLSPENLEIPKIENSVDLEITQPTKSNFNSTEFDASFVSDSFKQQKKERGSVPEQNGFLAIPHELFQLVVQKIRRKHDSDVFSCLLRMSLGWGKDTCEASNSYISKWTAIADKGNVSRAVQRLISNGYIEIAREPDYRANRGTVYRVPLATSYLQKTGKSAGTVPDSILIKNTDTSNIQPGVNNTSHSISDPGLNSQPVGCTDDNPPVVQSTTNKELLNKSYKELSLSSLILKSYLEDIPTSGQRNTEREFLEKILREGTKEAVLEKSLTEVVKSGIPPRGEKCIMPMKWLYSSGGSILQKHHADLVKISSSLGFSFEKAFSELNETSPRWVDFDSWKKSLSEANILFCVISGSGQTEAYGRTLVSDNKDPIKSFVVEACLRSYFISENKK